MVGDTTFDIEMAAAAGVRSVAVSWGYHPVPALLAAGAGAVIDHFDALDGALAALEAA
jgi:phosphoglycolate phosphatase